jgi:multidrug efflux system membrane fusion protein
MRNLVGSRGGACTLLVLGGLALALAGCDQPSASSSDKAKAAPPAKPPPPVVTVSRPVVREIVEWDEYTARFDAMEQVEVRARVSGYLMNVAFKDGQFVKKGDLLYEIDARPFERALDQARAELAQAVTKAENASLDVERGRPLVERRVMSEKVFDDRSNLLREAQAAMKVAEAKVATAELDLAFTRITAPIDGRIGRSLVTPGNWISAGAAANATLLTSIVSQDPIYLYFDVSEANYLKYKRLAERGETTGGAVLGGTVEIAMADERNFPHRGRLDFLDNRLDQGTATLRARAVVDNPSQLFSPGMFARVRIPGTPRYQAILLPDAAIGTDQASKFVLVVGADNVVARRPVRLGPLDGGLRVIREGIKADDWVVTNGIQRARPGMTVEPKRDAAGAAGGPAASSSGVPPSAAAPAHRN